MQGPGIDAASLTNDPASNSSPPRSCFARQSTNGTNRKKPAGNKGSRKACTANRGVALTWQSGRHLGARSREIEVKRLACFGQCPAG